MQFVRDDVSEARKQAADAKAMVDSLKVDFESLRGDFETLKYQSAGGGKLDDLMHRLDALDARIAAIEQSRGPVTGTPPPPGGEAPAMVAPTPGASEGPLASIPVPASAPAEYRDGIELLRRGDNGGAIQKLREFLRKSPKSDLADDAQYWIGEAYFANRDYNRAILEFNEVLLRYPKGDKVPAALLRQAMAFAELGDKVDARLVLQKLVSEHGDSPEAEKGRQKLAELSS
ncbi:MAG TPA: tol-pal system protein YbgF [Casimicrobiaceae bacterium]|nr:tol-pal system protein YbgF [Casimicrobiaceae bacterium]